VYGWNTTYGPNVYQGNAATWGGPASNSGSWFYGNAASQLLGATITRVAFRLPKRTSGGATSSTVTAHFYLHQSSQKPGGDVARVSGPHNIGIAPGYKGGDWVDLPLAWGPTLVAGGGVSISGDPYMGFVGKSAADPESGLLQLTWER
jgi:hypothetical protein